MFFCVVGVVLYRGSSGWRFSIFGFGLTYLFFWVVGVVICRGSSSSGVFIGGWFTYCTGSINGCSKGDNFLVCPFPSYTFPSLFFLFWVTLSLLYFFSSRNPLLVLDCCLTVSRGGRRVQFVHYLHFYNVLDNWVECSVLNLGFYGFQRFGNIAGLFQVMSVAIKALDKGDVDHNYLAKLAKIATSEVISTKVKDTL